MRKTLITILTVLGMVCSTFGQGVIESRNITYTGINTYNTNSIAFSDGTHLGVSNGELSTTTPTKTNTVATSENISEVIKEGVVLVTNLTYSGTNIYSDFSIASSFRVTLTNNAYLHFPTNMVDAQVLKWVIKQGAGGPYTLTLDPNYVLPEGTTSLQLSTNAYYKDKLIGTYDASTNCVNLEGLLLFRR